jgi:hypothetical protein
MTGVKIGNKVKIRHVDGEFRYILDVEVTAILSSDEFIGRVERIFSDSGDRGEVTGGQVFARFRGKEHRFKNTEIT